MKIYLAGCDGDKQASLLTGQNVLSSFFSIPFDGPEKFVNAHGPYKSYFMDCGAFSAWSQGTSIDIDKYCQFILHHQHRLDVYAHLDDKNSEKKTMENLEIMETKYKLKPLPVWHAVNRNFKLLGELLEKYDYIAIGAMAGEGGKDEVLHDTLKIIFSMALKYGKNKDGTLKKRFHAFGWTGFNWLVRYPWYSADSTSWLAGSRFGTIPIFNIKTGKMMTIPITKEAILKNWKHIPRKLRNLEKLLDKKGSRNYENRLKVAIEAYSTLEERVTKIWTARGINF